jgi:ABC-type amino acid transport substrate-binding protein
MMRFIRACFFSCLLPILQAQKPLPYVVGLPDTQLYPQYWNLSGKVDGYLPRILERFAAESGMRWELRAQPIKRYYVEFNEGRLDFIAPSNPAWAERNSRAVITYSDPIMKSRAGFIGITPDFDPAKIKQVTTLAGYTISFLTDPKTLFKDAKVNYVNDVNSAMMVLASKRTDLIYLHHDAAREWIRMSATVKADAKLKAKVTFVFHEKYSEEFDYCLASIRYPKVIEAFNRWLREHPQILEEVKASIATSKYP